jgi:hypothetical protein
MFNMNNRGLVPKPLLVCDQAQLHSFDASNPQSQSPPQTKVKLRGDLKTKE